MVSTQDFIRPGFISIFAREVADIETFRASTPSRRQQGNGIGGGIAIHYLRLGDSGIAVTSQDFGIDDLIGSHGEVGPATYGVRRALGPAETGCYLPREPVFVIVGVNAECQSELLQVAGAVNTSGPCFGLG